MRETNNAIIFIEPHAAAKVRQPLVPLHGRRAALARRKQDRPDKLVSSMPVSHTLAQSLDYRPWLGESPLPEIDAETEQRMGSVP
jgi:hypothetical protein